MENPIRRELLQIIQMIIRLLELRKGRNSSGNGKSHTGTVNPEGHDLVNTPNSGTGIGLDTKDSFEGTPKPKKEEVVPLSSVRLIRRDDDQYKLIFVHRKM